jgi:hypothetical protein
VPDGPTAVAKGCTNWSEIKECFDNSGDTEGFETDTEGLGVDCSGWNPPWAVWPQTGGYRVDPGEVAALQADPYLLTCDSARWEVASGGYFRLVDVDPSDFVYALGLRTGDKLLGIREPGGFTYNLKFTDNVLTAYNLLHTKTALELVYLDASGTFRTIRYDIY